MGAGCKPAGLRLRRFKSFSAHHFHRTSVSQQSAGVAQLVEQEFSKLQVIGSSPFTRSICPCSSGVEHFLGKEEVTGSNPVMGSTFIFPLSTEESRHG